MHQFSNLFTYLLNVIKLVNILREIGVEDHSDKAYAWQKPDGTFVHINYSHDSEAFKLVGGDPKNDHTLMLWKRGWQRITYATKLSVIYANNEVQQPNDKQKAKLIELAVKLGFQSVVWDGGRNKKDKVIWSAHDVLEENDEERHKKLAYSWQEPDGNFIPIDYSHGSDALIYARGDAKDDNIANLWRKGWQRITYYGRAIYANNEFHLPNDIQTRKLIELAMRMEFEKVEWDGGEKTKILWSVHDILEESVNNLNRTKRLIPLIKLANRYNTFEEFERDYQGKNYHGIYWHLTNQPNFQINPTQSPTDLSTLSFGKSSTPGLMVSTDLSNWYSTFRGTRKYAAQIDLSDLTPNVDYRHVGRGFGHEIFVFKPEKAKVVKTYPIKNALAINLRDYKEVFPQSQDELKRLYWFAKQKSSSLPKTSW
jgi:hypothetical protein